MDAYASPANDGCHANKDAYALIRECQKYLKERSHTVEPMQGLVKEIFDLDRCWMRKDDNNRWLFGAMGLAVQMHQLSEFGSIGQAYGKHKSTWKIKSAVLGEP